MAKAAPISPLAPKTTPEIPPIDGVRFAAGVAGVRYKGRTDVMLALLDEGTRVAGVFTKSKCLRLRSIGAGRASRAARPARCSSIPATPTPSPARPARTP